MRFHAQDGVAEFDPLPQVEQAVNRIEAFLLANRERFDIQSVYSRYDASSAQTLLQLTPKGAATPGGRDGRFGRFGARLLRGRPDRGLRRA